MINNSFRIMTPIVSGLMAILAIFIASSIIIQPSYAQTNDETSGQVTLSEDLENNPIAQDILRKIEQTKKWIEEINQHIREVEGELADEKKALKKLYDMQYDELFSKSKKAEKDAVKEYNESLDMSKEQLSNAINSIREKYESDKEDILGDKIKDTKKLEKEHEGQMLKFAQGYDLDPYIKVVLNFGKTGYEAVMRE